MTFSLVVLATALLLILGAMVRFRDLRQQELIEVLLQDVIDAQHRDIVDEAELCAREQRQLLAAFQRDARRLRNEDQASEAAATLTAGCQAISDLTPSFLDLLRQLRGLVRPLTAITPLEPLAPAALVARPLRGLAGLSVAVHHLLLTGRERVSWHLRSLGAGFRCGVFFLRRSSRRLPAHNAEWDHIDVLARDLDTIGLQSVAVARRIVLTLDAFDRLALLSKRGS